MLEDIRRSQERLRRELLSGQASILSELRSLRQAWQGRQSSEHTTADSMSFHRLSRGLEDITDSVTKNIEGLTAAFRETTGQVGEAFSSSAVGSAAVPPSPSALSGNRGRRRESLGVRFSSQRVSLHRGSTADPAEEEEHHREEHRLPSSSNAAAFMVETASRRLSEPRPAAKSSARRLSSTVDSGEPPGEEATSSANSEQVQAFVGTASGSTGARASWHNHVWVEATQGTASGSSSGPANSMASAALVSRDEGF